MQNSSVIVIFLFLAKFCGIPHCHFITSPFFTEVDLLIPSKILLETIFHKNLKCKFNIKQTFVI